MKFRLLFLLVFLLLGALLGHYMMQGSGYVLLSFGHWSFESSLWVFALMLFATMATLYGAVNLSITLIKSPSAFKGWSQQRNINSAIGKTVQGLIALAEGNWKQSEKLLMAGAHGKGKLINYLAAARAAQYEGNYEHCDQLIAQAIKSTKGAELAIGLQHAQLLLEREQFEQCLAICLRLKKQFPKHPFVNKILLKTHTALNDWQAVLDVLPQLNKHKLLPSKKSTELEINAYKKLINSMITSRSTNSKDPELLLVVWKKIPNRVLKHVDFAPIIHSFISHLLSLNAQHEAESQLRKVLQHTLDKTLIDLYGWIKGQDVRRQLIIAKDVVKQLPNDADALLMLGRVHLMNEEFEEAQHAFEISLSQKNKSETRSELSRLYLAKHEPEKALEMLRQGLGLQLPELPMPHM
jgi:HemY protein